MSIKKSIILIVVSFFSVLTYGNTGFTLSNGVETKIDYSIWEIILKKYINNKGDVDYKGLKRQEKMLDDFLTILESTKVDGSWEKKQKIAFWINVYNAYTIKLILQNYPVKSIKDIKKPWDKKFFYVNEQLLSLGDVEHQILRKEFDEPRIHFAINCASKSCPRVIQIPYTAKNLNNLLERQTKEYINNPELNNIEPELFKLSKLFSWFSKDFKQAEGSVINFVNKYSNTKIKNQKNRGAIEYDWSLNGK